MNAQELKAFFKSWINDDNDGEFVVNGETFQLHYSMLNDNSDQYAILDDAGCIVSWNDNWSDFIDSAEYFLNFMEMQA